MSGHGHVVPNPDGSKVRCGGPGVCGECSRELAGQYQPSGWTGSRPPTPIASLVRTLQAVVDAVVRQPDQRMMVKVCLDGIVGATADLWHCQGLESADHRRLMREALEFYAGGGIDQGECARKVLAIFEADRAEYWRAFPSYKVPPA
jgi:hypothetical protein